jgi:4-hydroxy-tetrahydrodipicolinate synthase
MINAILLKEVNAMLHERDLHGVFVPLVTPLQEDGRLDVDGFHRYVGGLAETSIAGIVVNGTTGESPTVSWEEVRLLTEAAREAARTQKQPIIVGTGTNDTASTVRRTELAGDGLGADAALVSVPYYSRPSQQGIIEHYKRAASTGVPIIAYENPSRTGVQLEADTVRAIMDIDGVIGLKDSTASLDLVSELSRSDCKPILCGTDENWFGSLCMGASGGILASANVRTAEFIEVQQLVAACRIPEARAAFDNLLPLIRLLFQESSPSPLKWLLTHQGIIASDAVRLPLTGISTELRHRLSAISLG